MPLQPFIGGIVRHVLTAGGGYLVAQGFIDAAQAQAAVGALMTLFGIGWSIYDKKLRA